MTESLIVTFVSLCDPREEGGGGGESRGGKRREVEGAGVQKEHGNDNFGLQMRPADSFHPNPSAEY